MNKWLMALSILLISQSMLTAISHLDTNEYAAYGAQEFLLDLDTRQIDRLEIRSAGSTLVFSKQNNI